MSTLSWTTHIDLLHKFSANAPQLFNFQEARFLNRLDERIRTFGYWDVTRSMGASECSRLARIYDRVAPLYNAWYKQMQQMIANRASKTAQYQERLNAAPYLVQQYAKMQTARKAMP